MGKRGPQPKPEGEKMVSVGLRMPAELKHQLSREVLRRKVADPKLPLSWGLSELLREIAVEHLAQVGAEARNGMPGTGDGTKPPATRRKKAEGAAARRKD